MPYIDFSPSQLEIEHALEMLLPKVQNIINNHYEEGFSRIKPPKIEVKRGSKYWKLIKVDLNQLTTSRSVYCFVRRSDGAVLKAASWSTPQLKTKNPICGFITEDECIDCFYAYGVRHVTH